jgi:hypothetical protein
VFLYEIEKAFAGTGTDLSGVKTELTGAILAWMQDRGSGTNGASVQECRDLLVDIAPEQNGESCGESCGLDRTPLLSPLRSSAAIRRAVGVRVNWSVPNMLSLQNILCIEGANR